MSKIGKTPVAIPAGVTVKVDGSAVSVEGKLGKLYSEICLMEQSFVKENKLTVKQYVDSKAKEAGAPIEVTAYVCFELGEGIEKKADDFAAEVASMIG